MKERIVVYLMRVEMYEIMSEDDIDLRRFDWLSFATPYQVLSSTVCIFGIAGNILRLSVFSRREMKSPVNCCLQFLATFDGLLLASFLSFVILPKDWQSIFSMDFDFGRRFKTEELWIQWTHVFMQAMASASGFATVGVSVERYIAVCYPLRARSLITYRRTVLCNLLAAAVAISLNIARIIWGAKFNQYSLLDHELYIYNRYDVREFVKSGTPFEPGISFVYFTRYYVWAEIVVLYCVPQVTIASLNICIRKAIIKAQAVRRELSIFQQAEINVSKSITAVIIVFFFCWTPTLIINIVSYYGIFRPKTYILLQLFCYLFLGFNSSANVVIYSAMRKDFKSAVWNAFCKRRRVSNTENSESTAL